MTEQELHFFFNYGPYIIGGVMLLGMAGVVWLLIYLIKSVGNPPRQ